MIVSGRVAHKMAPPIRQLYEQMLEPKWVMAMGACSSTAGMFANYAVLQGVDKIIPVDVYVPGCPPRPEAVIEGLITLQKPIRAGIPPAYDRQESRRVTPLEPGATGGLDVDLGPDPSTCASALERLARRRARRATCVLGASGSVTATSSR